MTAADYAAKKAAGGCLGRRNCRNRPIPGNVRCRKCRADHVKGDRNRRRRKKLEGECGTSGCHAKADGFYCAPCAEKRGAITKAWKARNADRLREYRKRWEAKRKATGQCRRCNQPVISQGWQLCRAHRDERLRREDAKRRAKGLPKRYARTLAPKIPPVPSIDHLKPMTLEELQARPDRKDIEARWATT